MFTVVPGMMPVWLFSYFTRSSESFLEYSFTVIPTLPVVITLWAVASPLKKASVPAAAMAMQITITDSNKSLRFMGLLLSCLEFR